MRIHFSAYARPEPQGSTRAFIPKGWKRPVITSDNPKVKSFRAEVARAALAAMKEAGEKMAVRAVAIHATFLFFLARPASTPKRVKQHTKRPDCSKLIRAAEDAMTGIVYEDDSQIAHIEARKLYGQPERVEITVESIEC